MSTLYHVLRSSKQLSNAPGEFKFAQHSTLGTIVIYGEARNLVTAPLATAAAAPDAIVLDVQLIRSRRRWRQPIISVALDEHTAVQEEVHA